MPAHAGQAEAAAWLERIRAATDGAQAADLARRAVGASGNGATGMDTSGKDRSGMGTSGIDAPAFLLALKDSSKAMLTVDPSRAVVLAEALVAGAEAAKLPWFQALARMARGDAFGAQGGRIADAVAELDAAAAAFRALEDDVAWSRTRIGWIYLRTLSGMATEADIQTAEQARETLVRAGEHKLAVTLDRNLMLCHWHRGQLDRADACFARALSSADGPDQALGALEEAWLRANRGLMLTSQARLTEALAEHRRARDLFQDLGQRESLRRQEHNLGHLFLVMGDHAQALTHFYSGLSLTESDGLALPRGLVLANIARCHIALGCLAEGVAEAREALTVLRQQGADAESLRCSLALAQGLSALGDSAAAQEAERILVACLADPRLPGLRVQDGMARLDLAELALRRGDAPSAMRWSAEAQERFHIGDLGLLGLVARLVAADASLLAGNVQTAGTAAVELREQASRQGLTALLPRTWHLTARVAEAQNRDAAAREAYREAVDCLDSRLERLPPLLRTHVLDDQLGLMADALTCYRRTAGTDDLWWMLERTKATTVTDRLLEEGARAGLEVVDGPLAGTDPGVAILVANLRGAEREQADLFSLRHAPDWLPESRATLQRGPADLAAMDMRLERAESEVIRLRERLALFGWEHVDHAAQKLRREDWDPPHPPDGTLLVAFGLTATDPFVLVARGDRRRSVALRQPAGQLIALSDRWREAVEDANTQAAAGLPADALTAPLNDLLARLYRALIAPWQDWLDGASQLMVLPHGALHGLPFAALHDGNKHLIEGLEIGVAPSTAWWEACSRRGPARPKGLVAAYSHGGALPGATAEAQRVAAILGLRPLLEAAASRDAVLAGAKGAGLLHLAAHAAARQDRPTFAHLWLAGGELLSSHDLANSDLHGALVTLSGCETGQGRLTGGDEMLSLSRACLQAGAATVLGTLWPLRDAAALPLMTALYEGLRRGLPVGSALRGAQLSALHGDWPSPLDWAAFQCLGSCDTMLPTVLTQEVPP